jgi:hypothetical protein
VTPFVVVLTLQVARGAHVTFCAAVHTDDTTGAARLIGSSKDGTQVSRMEVLEAICNVFSWNKPQTKPLDHGPARMTEPQ